MKQRKVSKAERAAKKAKQERRKRVSASRRVDSIMRAEAAIQQEALRNADALEKIEFPGGALPVAILLRLIPNKGAQRTSDVFLARQIAKWIGEITDEEKKGHKP